MIDWAISPCHGGCQPPCVREAYPLPAWIDDAIETDPVFRV